MPSYPPIEIAPALPSDLKALDQMITDYNITEAELNVIP